MGFWRRVRDGERKGRGEGFEFRSAQGGRDSRPPGGLRYSPDIEMSKPSHHWNCQSLPLPPFPRVPSPSPIFLSTLIVLSFPQHGTSARKMFDSCLSFSGSSARGFITMRLYYQDFKTRSIGLSLSSPPFSSLKLLILIHLIGADFTEESMNSLYQITSQCFRLLMIALGSVTRPLFLFFLNPDAINKFFQTFIYINKFTHANV